MIFSKVLYGLNAYLVSILGGTALLGDYLVKNTKIPFAKAAFDNTTHSIVGGLCWVIFYINFNKAGYTVKQILLEIFGCSLLSSLIDLDHFIAAKSLRLKDASSLKQRPFLHCSTIPLLLFILLMLTSYVFQAPLLKRYGLLFLTAFMSHHIRDATRRGMWFFPYGSTPPIPYGLYVVFTCLIPYVMLFINKYVIVDQKVLYDDIHDVI